MRMNRDDIGEAPPRRLSFLNHTPRAMAWLAFIAAIFCLAGAPASTLAQTPEPQPQRANRRQQRSMNELMQLADTVVYGQVVSKKSDWNDRRTMIYTTVTIAVDRTVKGKATSTLSFQQLGGQVGKLKTTVSHLPDFSPGEEVLLFLNLAKGNKISPLVDFGAGKYVLHKDVKTETAYLNDASVNLPIFSARTHRSITPAELRGSGRVALYDLLYSLQRVTAAGTVNAQRGGK